MSQKIGADLKTKVFMEPIASDGACSPEEVEKRDPAKHAAEWGQKGYAVSFRYFEQDAVVVGGKELNGDKRYDKGEYYLGSIRTVSEQAEQIDNEWMRDNFLHNTQQEGAEFVAVQENGRASTLRPDDFVVSAEGVVTKVSDHAADQVLKI